jgi:hypothetical protein
MGHPGLAEERDERFRSSGCSLLLMITLHKIVKAMAANNFVQATPVCAILFVLSQVPGVPDDNRYALH